MMYCSRKDCGATNKHPSGLCAKHRKEWIAGYEYALREKNEPI